MDEGTEEMDRGEYYRRVREANRTIEGRGEKEISADDFERQYLSVLNRGSTEPTDDPYQNFESRTIFEYFKERDPDFLRDAYRAMEMVAQKLRSERDEYEEANNGIIRLLREGKRLNEIGRHDEADALGDERDALLKRMKEIKKPIHAISSNFGGLAHRISDDDVSPMRENGLKIRVGRIIDEYTDNEGRVLEEATITDS